MKRISIHYNVPLHTLETMPLGVFHREIATLLAEAIVREAQRIGARTGDKKERRALDAEYTKLKTSDDWFDRLIVERIRLDAKRP